MPAAHDPIRAGYSRRKMRFRDDIERIGAQRSWAAIRGGRCRALPARPPTRLGDAAYDSADPAIFARLPLRPVLLHVDNKMDEGAADRQNHGQASTSPSRPRPARAQHCGPNCGRRRLAKAPRRRVHRPRAPPAGPASHAGARRPGRRARAFAHARPGTAGRRASPGAMPWADQYAFTADDLLGEIFSRFCIGK